MKRPCVGSKTGVHQVLGLYLMDLDGIGRLRMATPEEPNRRFGSCGSNRGRTVNPSKRGVKWTSLYLDPPRVPCLEAYILGSVGASIGDPLESPGTKLYLQ